MARQQKKTDVTADNDFGAAVRANIHKGLQARQHDSAAETAARMKREEEQRRIAVWEASLASARGELTQALQTAEKATSGKIKPGQLVKNAGVQILGANGNRPIAIAKIRRNGDGEVRIGLENSYKKIRHGELPVVEIGVQDFYDEPKRKKAVETFVIQFSGFAARKGLIN